MFESILLSDSLTMRWSLHAESAWAEGFVGMSTAYVWPKCVAFSVMFYLVRMDSTTVDII